MSRFFESGEGTNCWHCRPKTDNKYKFDMRYNLSNIFCVEGKSADDVVCVGKTKINGNWGSESVVEIENQEWRVFLHIIMMLMKNMWIVLCLSGDEVAAQSFSGCCWEVSFYFSFVEIPLIHFRIPFSLQLCHSIRRKLRSTSQLLFMFPLPISSPLIDDDKLLRLHQTNFFLSTP